MGFLGKLTRRGAAEEEEETELEDPGTGQADALGNGGRRGLGLLSKAFKKRGKVQDDDEEDTSGGSDEVQDERGESPALLVRLDGVPDVHPVGAAAAAMPPAQAQVGGGSATRPGSSVGGRSGEPAPGPASPPGPASQGEAASIDPAGHTEAAAVDEAKAGPDKDPAGLDLSLKDIFEEGIEVDQRLKDLADSQEDVSAIELSTELRRFMEELEG